MRRVRTKTEQRQARVIGRASLLAAVLVGGGALAQERIQASAMRCADLAGTVRARGAAIVTTGPITYERLVRDQSFCELETTTAPAWVASADDPQCFAGYRCRPIERGESKDSG
jgi:hypothetical protein